MSVRGTKRTSGVRGEEAGSSKRRRAEPDDALWQLPPASDLKMSSIYNRNASEAPAELFRKDLISAMKLPDSEPLNPSEYWVITDTWKQDWERGVQVPVNPDSLPAPKVKIIENPLPPGFKEFKLPRDKYIHLNRDSHFVPEKHQLSTTLARAEQACAYDLDASDTSWLRLLNAERARAGAAPITEDQLERVIQELEVRCWDKIQAIVKSEEGLGIEYDENVICDVCRSPDSEDGNEMVFCDSCNICVHQACYGITVIPPGQWLCRPCADGVRPTCVLCPNYGGAMKCTPSGHKWAHVSCVLWIPEVSIGCAEKMEPITKISAIPASRWSLSCILCRERKGACIQCSVKTCKTAYHVTCAFKHGLEMRAIIEDENADDGVKLRSYCQKHSMNSKKEKCPGSGSEEEEVKRKRRKDMTSEEKNQARAARLQEIEREFDRHVSVKDISTHLHEIDQDAINYIYNYWKLKRRAGHNRPLLPPKSDDNDLLSHRQEQADLDKMKMFVQLRQDLERVRNLCYMVSRREKLSRSFFRMREQTFHKQVAVLSADVEISGPDLSAIIEANHGPSIYDRLYSHANAPDHKDDFDEMLARIAGTESGEDKKKDLNGLMKAGKSSNPYKKHYVNGSSRRSGSYYSGLSSEESASETSRPQQKYRGRTIGSSTDEGSPKKKPASPRKKISPKAAAKKSPKKTSKKRTPQSKAIIETSSEDDSVKASFRKDKSRSKTLQQMEKEMTAGKAGQSSESDDLMPMRTTRNSKFPVDIYSDSSDNDADVKSENINSDKSPNATNDSMQPLPRTKGAMKEFIPTQPVQKADKADVKEPKKRGRKPSNYKDKKTSESKDDTKVKDEVQFSKTTKDNPTDLIVPQRQAAKKASENMRTTTTTTTKVKDEQSCDKHTSGDDPQPKTIKTKKDKDCKVVKEVVKEVNSKEPLKRKYSNTEIETIAYVPQRQAAKKAAAHIKSGLGNKPPVSTEGSEEKKKEPEKLDQPKKSPKKDEERFSKTPLKSSSSSSSNSSSSTYSSSSSSDEEDDKPEAKPMAKAREIKPAARQPPAPTPGTRPTVDLPFLDKVSRPLSSTSASSDSESSKDSRLSNSSSPAPKRPRRRRKAKSASIDVSPRKAPDKKLKTSERGSMCGVPSPVAEGEEPNRHNDTRTATRARTRSTTSSGNMLNKSDSRPRKPSKDDTSLAVGLKEESAKSSEFSTAERKTDEALNADALSSPSKGPKHDSKAAAKDRRSSITDDAQEIVSKTSPTKKSITNRRLSIRDSSLELNTVKEMWPSLRDDQSLESAVTKPKTPTKKSPLKPNDDYSVSDGHWFAKAPSPSVLPPPVEKPGDHEKYMTEDNSDFTDRSSIKMIAKIQANLNENTMIRSPKTPMDARMLNMDHIDIEHPIIRNTRKLSKEQDKKFISHDVSHVQGVEISKSAKIPSTANQYSSKSMFSPQSKENELFDIDMMAVEGFNNDGMMKNFQYTDPFMFKVDSKEQGVQETLNLVDRLRMQLSSKKVTAENANQDESASHQDKSTDDKSKLSTMGIDLVTRSPRKDAFKSIENHFARSTPPVDLTPKDMNKPPSIMNDDKWPDLPPTPRIDPHLNMSEDGKYDSIPYIDDKIKESTTVQSDILSTSEVDRDTISKQSDDSQSLSVVDHSVHSNDQESLMQDNQNYDNNNSMIHSDCATISSPYVSQDSKWRESKITHRRSSASSSNSDESLCSQKADMKSHLMSCDSRQSNVIPEIESYPPLPSYSCPIEPSIGLNQYSAYPPESSPFISAMGSMPLFTPGACSSSGLPLPSPGPGLFPPSLSVPFSSPLMQPLPKPPNYPTLCAAFTSSSQNIALTTAMIAPPTPKPSDSPVDDIDITGSDKFSMQGASSPSVDSCNDICSIRPPTSTTSKASNENSNETASSVSNQESKSPMKPTKTGIKLTSHGKSPGKSPGFSPKNLDTPKPPSTKRQNNKNNRSQRGKGRSKSRAHGYLPNADYMGNSIQSKLVGTVYDFDEEIANDGVDLKALRERRKSIDAHERKSESSLKESSRSPLTASPHSSKKAASQTSKGSTPRGAPSPRGSPAVGKGAAEGAPVVQAVLPGPVNMRTYAAEGAPPAGDGYHTHLIAFASGAADQHLGDIDEEVEQQLHSALRSVKPDSPPPPGAPPPADARPAPAQVHLPKVSLSDSRNQLKVKIKGPFLDANYSSSVQPAAPQPPVPSHESAASMSVATPSGSSSMSGTTNLRRMRKKELLLNWTQNMNLDDPTNSSTAGSVPAPAAPQPPARAVITIPKAVSSMTSIPTREDYKGVSDFIVDKKKRKTTSGLSRELRHLEVSMNDDVDPSEIVSTPQSHKRRGRTSTKPNKTTSPLAPKLKIKIGSSFIQPVSTEESSSGFQFKPPKKRLASIPKPSIEDLRRESMKYRRMVMADFEEDEKGKKHKPNKSEKRKKKKDKKSEKLLVINSDSDSAKLIIKIKRPVEEEAAGASEAAAGAEPAVAVDPFEYDPAAPDPLALDPPAHAGAAALRRIRSAKVTPIRLKLARSAEGSGYVMKAPGEDADQVPLALNKHCEVR